MDWGELETISICIVCVTDGVGERDERMHRGKGVVCKEALGYKQNTSFVPATLWL